MIGYINSITARPGERPRLIELLLQGSGDMPGCIAYIVAADITNADLIWITEVWDTAESHQASLSLPAVLASIEQARPLIAGFENVATTDVVAQQGLPGSE
jgi:quinol monooxygenase YgiN